MTPLVPSSAPADEIFVDVLSLVNARVPSWLKTAALKAARHPAQGFTIGSFLSSASDEHLSDILEALRRVKTGGEQDVTDLNLLALLLAQGEGLVVRVTDSVSDLTERVLVLIQAERARRQGLIPFQPLYLSLESLAQAGLVLTRKGGKLLLEVLPPKAS